MRRGLLKSAIRDPNPVIFLENEVLYGQSFPVPKLDDFTVPIGKARVHRKGDGRHHRLLRHRHEATPSRRRRNWPGEGIEAEIIDLRTIRPMDSDTVIASVMKTGRCVAVEEGFPQSGVTAEIATRIMEQAFDYLDAPVARVTGKDVPMPYARQSREARPAERRRGRPGRESRLLQVSDMSDKPQFHELAVPPDVAEKGGHEVLRASVVEGEVEYPPCGARSTIHSPGGAVPRTSRAMPRGSICA